MEESSERCQVKGTDHQHQIGVEFMLIVLAVRYGYPCQADHVHPLDGQGNPGKPACMRVEWINLSIMVDLLSRKKG